MACTRHTINRAMGSRALRVLIPVTVCLTVGRLIANVYLSIHVSKATVHKVVVDVLAGGGRVGV